MASNKSLAEYNLSWEPKINIGKQKLVELYQTASQLERSVQEKEKKLEQHGEIVPLDAALVMLQSSASQAEEESEGLADKFMDRTLDVETFLEEFQLRRKNAHLRRVKTDKMKELMAKQKQQNPGLTSPMRPAPPPPSYMNQPPLAASASPVPPYPVAPVGNLPYPLFPPSQQPSGLPYPVFPPRY